MKFELVFQGWVEGEGLECGNLLHAPPSSVPPRFKVQVYHEAPQLQEEPGLVSALRNSQQTNVNVQKLDLP